VRRGASRSATAAARSPPRRRLLAAAAGARLRRGLIRYCVVVLDLSSSATETDVRPSRLGLLSALLPPFIRAFFSTNPLSQLGLSVARQGLCERVAELSGSPEAHCAALQRLLSRPACSGGQLSLQNVVDQAVASLAHVPPYGSRELLILQSSLASCDPVRAAQTDPGRSDMCAGQHPPLAGGGEGCARARLHHRLWRRGASADPGRRFPN